MLCLVDPRSTNGIVIALNGMVIFAKTLLQRSIAFLAREYVTMAVCDTGKSIKY
jgi:hypothetical protein